MHLWRKPAFARPKSYSAGLRFRLVRSSQRRAAPFSCSWTSISLPATRSVHPSSQWPNHVDGGGTALTSNTALSRSLMTLSWLFLPCSLISLILSSASLFASSSAFLFPWECYSAVVYRQISRRQR